MGFLDWLLGRGTSNSKDIAKERLQFVLVHDRANIPPALVETLKDEIITVISKHLEIDQDGMKVSVTHGSDNKRLVADIPIVDVRKVQRQRKTADGQPADST